MLMVSVREMRAGQTISIVNTPYFDSNKASQNFDDVV
jgi:hypothetical protein